MEGPEEEEEEVKHRIHLLCFSPSLVPSQMDSFHPAVDNNLYEVMELRRLWIIFQS